MKGVRGEYTVGERSITFLKEVEFWTVSNSPIRGAKVPQRNGHFVCLDCNFLHKIILFKHLTV